MAHLPASKELAKPEYPDVVIPPSQFAHVSMREQGASSSLEVTTAGIINPKRGSNALDYTTRLPTETLVMIFKECNDPIRFWDTPWAVVAKVCQRWRVILLSTPTLWTNIALHRSQAIYPGLLQTRLERSGRALLSFNIRLVGCPYASLVFQRMLDELPRTKEIELHERPPIVGSLRWPQTVPSLRCLRLKYSEYRRECAIDKAFSRGLCERFPALNKLYVRGYTYAWKEWILPQRLTSLVIINEQAPSGSSMVEIVDVLRQLPLLEELHLSNALPLGVRTSQDTEPLSLPLLTDLSLQGDAEDQCSLLHLLIFPSSARLRLCLNGQHGFSDMPDLPSLATYLSRIPALQSISMYTVGGPIWCKYNLNFSFRGWRNLQTMKTIQSTVPLLKRVDFGWPPYDVEPDLHLDILVPGAKSGQRRKDWLPVLDLLAVLPLSQTRILHLDCSHGPLLDVTDIYRTMDEVHSLSLFGSGKYPPDRSFHRLMDMLEAYPESGGLFPKLRVFHASGLVFEGMVNRFKEHFRGHYPDMTCDIYLWGCYHLTSADVEALAEVANVQWDQRFYILGPHADTGGYVPRNAIREAQWVL